MRTPLLIWILISLNVVIFLWQQGRSPERLENWALIPKRDGTLLDPQNVSSIFTHAGFDHLLYNMMALYLFGSPLEQSIGAFHTGAIFIFGGVVSNLLYSLLYRKSQVGLVGASGAISAIAAAYYLQFSRRRSMFTWILFQLLGILLFAKSGISFTSHLFGFGAGLLYAGAFL